MSFPEELDPTPEVEADTRSDIEAAFEHHEAEMGETPPASDAPPPPPLEGEPGEAHPSGDGRVRDEAGRFAKRTKAVEAEVRHGEPAPKAAQGTPGAPAPGEPAAPVIAGPKVPASWKPEVRTHWDKLPPEVRQEVTRREAQVQAALTESASARNIAEQFMQTVQPYMGFIRAENANPMQAVDNLFKTAIALRTAPPGHKAELVAGLVKEFGIDLSMLDSALAGQAMPPQAMQPQVDPRALVQEELNRFKQGLMQERQQAVVQQTVGEVERWAQGKEFYEDVRATMADIMDLKAQQGVDLSLDQAYSMAVQMHPEHSKVFSQRQAAAVAQTAKAATAKARAASSSVRSSPSLGANPASGQTGNARDDIAAAWEELAGR